jgi:hypothetical protein
MLQRLHNERVGDEEFDGYASRLSSILERKVQMIVSFQDEVDALRVHLLRQQELSAKGVSKRL